MGFKEKVVEKKNQVLGSLTSPKVVKFCAISASLIWVLSLIIAYIVAQLDPAGPSYDPAGYNFLINYISDLGSLRFTPMPIILDFAMMQTTILMVPIVLYLKKVLIGDGSKVLRKLWSNLTLICLLIAMCGLFLTGVISEDVGEKLDAIIGPPIPDYYWHDIVADFAFIFFMIGGVLVASEFIIFPNILKEEIGLKRTVTARVLLAINAWILTPIFFGFFYTVPYLWYTDAFWTYLPLWQWAPFWEWLLMFSLSAWLISTFLILLKPLNRELTSK
ncbi:MAG: DUF998 domain-containing protein [Promethearchaeota archaeon]